MSQMHKALTWTCLVLLFTSLLTPAKPASANAWPTLDSLALINASCPSDATRHEELKRLKDEIAVAETVDQARKMALAPTDEAIQALESANGLLPFSDDLREAQTRLSNARSQILLASSKEQVSDAFSGMMLAGLDDDSAARVNVGSESCNYSSGEVIAIVIGLILGIIPGLILLVVLC